MLFAEQIAVEFVLCAQWKMALADAAAVDVRQFYTTNSVQDKSFTT